MHRAALQRAWLRRGVLSTILLPIAAIYAALLGLRRTLYRRGLRPRVRLPVPVIVVGNVIAGGAGKTPVTIALVEHLRTRGLSPGVISRGWGRRTHTGLPVTTASDPIDAGDEPVLIARRCNVPVQVDANRPRAGFALLAEHPGTDVLVADDGLQHLALARDLEVVVFDDRGTGNGRLLPAGPLREPWPRPADLVLRPATLPAIGGHDVRRQLAGWAIRADGVRRDLGDLAARPVAALAAIARPERFFEMLRDAGFEVRQTIALPDHHPVDAGVVPSQADVLLCTEKDAVKLWRIRPDAWAVPLDVSIAPSFWRELDAHLDRLFARAPLSSANGSQAARAAGLPGHQGLSRPGP